MEQPRAWGVVLRPAGGPNRLGSGWEAPAPCAYTSLRSRPLTGRALRVLIDSARRIPFLTVNIPRRMCGAQSDSLSNCHRFGRFLLG